MAAFYPWLDWQTNGSERVSLNDYYTRPCPFCSKLHLSLEFGFDGKSGRIECRNCLKQGPWGWGTDKKSVIESVLVKWNTQGEDLDPI